MAVWRRWCYAGLSANAGVGVATDSLVVVLVEAAGLAAEGVTTQWRLQTADGENSGCRRRRAYDTAALTAHSAKKSRSCWLDCDLLEWGVRRREPREILAVPRVFHDGGDLRVRVIIPLVLEIPQRLPHVRHHLRVVLITLVHAPLQRLLHLPALHQILDVAPRVRRVAHDQLDHRHPHVAQRVAFAGRPRLQGGGAEGVVDIGVFLRAGFARAVDQRVRALLLLLVAMDDEWEEGDGK
nr:hypothetical protein Iba_chr12aCG1050 [Ipomoea batatas]